MKVLVLWMVAARIVLLPVVGYAQNDCSNVQGIPSGRTIAVTNEAGGTITGLLDRVTDSELTLRGKVAFDRLQVRRVETVRGNKKARAAMGFLIGFGITGTLIAATIPSNKAFWALSVGGAWGGIGALIGAATGGEAKTVVYLAP